MKHAYDLVLAASASRTADPTLAPASLGGEGCRGVIVAVVVTNAGTGSITAHIEGWGEASQTWYTILSGAAVTTNSTNVYVVYPGLTAVANSRADFPLPRKFRVRLAHSNANAITYSVGASLLF